VILQIAAAAEFSRHLRLPAWCDRGAQLWVNDARWEAELTPGTYVELQRR
jgi:DUF1680 family protein